MDVVLSPNGQSRFDGASAPSRLFVATATSVAILERASPSASWRLAAKTLEDHHVSTMTLLPDGAGVLAGTHGDGVFWSADGRQWQERNAGLRIRDMYTLAAVKENGATVVYAGTEPASLFKSLDLGQSWTELPAIAEQKNKAWTFPAPPHVAHTKMLAFDPREPRHFFAAIEQGALLETCDAGQSWRELADYSRETDRAYKDLHQIVIAPSRPERMFMTAGCGSYRSEDAGLHWTRMTGEDFRIAYPDHIALSPDEKTLFLSGARVHPGIWRQKHDAGTTIFRSRDSGAHWEQLTHGIPETAPCNIEAMSVAAWPGGYSLFLGDTDGAVHISEDGGDSFTRLAETVSPVSKGNHFVPLQRAAAAAE
ncbi:MAG TPA: hypothetical protein VGL83_14595 [Stellaceae bacterium]|jgi:photosystem II stability/assembly factor-like uncharacterized protein